MRRVEDITEALWGTRVSPSTVSDLNKKIYATIAKAAMTRLLDAGRIRTEPLGRSDRSSYRLVPWQEIPQ